MTAEGGLKGAGVVLERNNPKVISPRKRMKFK